MKKEIKEKNKLGILTLEKLTYAFYSKIKFGSENWLNRHYD